MFEIRRVQGGARGRSAGSACGGFAWAVATSDDPVADMYRQTRNALAKIDGILAGLGTDKTKLVNATVYVDKMQLKAEMDRAWCAWIGDDPGHWPQRACVEARLHEYDLVEVVVIAAAPVAGGS
jgi:enamine deaminase RidA (YjgF/YER057c/UK114 family)